MSSNIVQGNVYLVLYEKQHKIVFSKASFKSGNVRRTSLSVSEASGVGERHAFVYYTCYIRQVMQFLIYFFV